MKLVGSIWVKGKFKLLGHTISGHKTKQNKTTKKTHKTHKKSCFGNNFFSSLSLFFFFLFRWSIFYKCIPKCFDLLARLYCKVERRGRKIKGLFQIISWRRNHRIVVKSSCKASRGEVRGAVRNPRCARMGTCCADLDFHGLFPCKVVKQTSFRKSDFKKWTEN